MSEGERMSDEENREGVDLSGSSEDFQKREKSLRELNRLKAEIRRRMLTIVEHPGISEGFKTHLTVRKWI